MPETAAINSPPTLGAMIDEASAIRERRRAIAQEDKVLATRAAELETAIIAALDAQETTMSRGSRATVTITESVVPGEIDWNQVYQYIEENNAPFILERRIALGAYRELVEAGTPLPGTTPFTKRGISLRNL